MHARRLPGATAVGTATRSWAGALTAVLFLVTVTALARWQMAPPTVRPASAPAAEFSAERAVSHLEAIARQPHPVGTAAHTAVREYIANQFTAAGLTPEFQDAVVPAEDGATTATMVTVHNVMARLKGAQPGRPLVLAAHYDSAPTGPGATDDGVGVAALLETLRALKAGPPLQNDVIFLVTDGEELGLLGARAWVKEHPWAKEAALFLNLEARGTSGAAFLFEVSPHNGELIRQVAGAVPHVTSNSLAYEIYKRMPNDTDVTAFKQLPGVAYLNVAPIGGWTHYHTVLDDLRHVSPGTVQQMGDYALGVARHFGSAALPVAPSGDAVWFTAFRWWLVRYPATWALPLAIIVALLACGSLALANRRRVLRGRELALGLLPLPLALVLTAGVISLVKRWLLMDALRPDWFGPACYLWALSATLAVYALFRRWIGTAASLAGGIVWWTAGSVALGALLPGGSFLMVWPLLFSLGGFVYLLRVGEERSGRPAGVGVLSLWAAPAVLLVLPMVFNLFDGLPSLPEAAAGLLVLLLGLCAPLLGVLAGRSRWWLPAGALLVAAALAVAGRWLPPDSAHPGRDVLYYGLDADSGQAWWLAPREKDEWTSRYVGAEEWQDRAPAFFPYVGYYWKAPAEPLRQLAAPELKVLDDRSENGKRTLRLQVTSPRQAPMVGLYSERGLEVASSSVDGRSVEFRCATTDVSCVPWSVTYVAPPSGGFEVVLTVPAGKPVVLRLIDRSFGLPPGTAPRPATLTPGWGPDWSVPTDSISVSRQYSL